MTFLEAKKVSTKKYLNFLTSKNVSTFLQNSAYTAYTHQVYQRIRRIQGVHDNFAFNFLLIFLWLKNCK
jgi:hypothetical protein